MKNLSGRTCILTGASRGIGPHIARALAAEGVDLALVARNKEQLGALASDLEPNGSRAVVVAEDLSDPAAVGRIIENSEGALGPIDILVHDAGISATEVFARQDEEEIEQMFRVNAISGIQLAHRLVPGMLERKRGHIVMMASLAGKVGMPFTPIYSATKAAQIAFVEGMYSELHGSGVGFSAVCPGFVRDAGMWYDQADPAGVGIPRTSGSTTPEAVAKATVEAIKKNRPEALVNFPPMRPLLTLGRMSPRFQSWFIRRTKMGEPFLKVLDHRRRQEGEPT
ncbi:MAG: SDR family NAD(P)-dependent oxidoreductase [Dehalococcoidia bacterium]